MTLVDTSVWVDFFRGRPRADDLAELLETNEVLLHPWVLGELALGNLGSEAQAIIADLRRLPEAPRVTDSEVLELVRARRISGTGIGWVDAQLLASALLAASAVWTFDRALGAVSAELGLGRQQ